ncbi:hypothetical protein MMC11_005313 [Xylographa trunciseda]|nr:hypothetical protein [Xylographa trunciseda]
MPSVKYFLNHQPNGFYSGSVLEDVDENGNLIVAELYRIDEQNRREDECVVQRDEQSDPLLTILCGSAPLPNDQIRGNSASSEQEKCYSPPTSASGTESPPIGTKVAESFRRFLKAGYAGQQLLALHRSTSKDPCLTAHHSTPLHTISDVLSDTGTSDSPPDSDILVLRYDLEQTNIATQEWPSLTHSQNFTAFVVSPSTSINHLIQVLDFISVVVREQDWHRQLVYWSKDIQNKWIAGDVLTLKPETGTRTLQELGWKGWVEDPVRVSLLRRPYCMKFQEDVGMWKVC